ncbi:MAG TPA: translation elongation factor Ts [Candidatus Pacearchaeota archaeon]|nr:translation elongation factor Ts [Candidatus Pacearchaeota archaeon]
MSIDQIKKLRAETGISISECKEALDSAQGDLEKAKEFLKKKGREIAANKSAREAHQGIIESYIHANGKVGVLIELRCESDFVAKSEQFQELARELAMQIAAMSPLYVRAEDIPEAVVEKEKEIYQEQMKGSNKPAEIAEKIIAGKLEKWYSEVVLLHQKWIKDDSRTVKDLINGLVSKLGENIEVAQFTRFEI